MVFKINVCTWLASGDNKMLYKKRWLGGLALLFGLAWVITGGIVVVHLNGYGHMTYHRDGALFITVYTYGNGNAIGIPYIFQIVDIFV